MLGLIFFCRLKSLDLVTMKKLDSKVNIIPVIAKSDTITKAELQKFKVCALRCEHNFEVFDKLNVISICDHLFILTG